MWAPILDVWISCTCKHINIFNYRVKIQHPSLYLKYYMFYYLYTHWTVLPRHIFNTLKHKKINCMWKQWRHYRKHMCVGQKQVQGKKITLWFPFRLMAKHRLHFSQWKYFSLGPILQGPNVYVCNMRKNSTNIGILTTRIVKSVLLTCIFHRADNDTASYPCQTSGKCYSSTPQTAHDTAGKSVVPRRVIWLSHIASVLLYPVQPEAMTLFLTYLLHGLTLRALHLSDIEAIHLVVLLCIVAQTTRVQFSTARCLSCISNTWLQCTGRWMTILSMILLLQHISSDGSAINYMWLLQHWNL